MAREPVTITTNNDDTPEPVKVKRGPAKFPRRSRGRPMEDILDDAVREIGSWELSIVGSTDQVTDALGKLTAAVERLTRVMQPPPDDREQDDR
jgi:hypothetical protein